jgi:uncharacterized membrane protein (UPF0136 family)
MDAPIVVYSLLFLIGFLVGWHRWLAGTALWAGVIAVVIVVRLDALGDPEPGAAD